MDKEFLEREEKLKKLNFDLDKKNEEIMMKLNLFNNPQKEIIENLNLEVTTNTKITLSNTDTIEFNPLGEFTIDVTGATGGSKSFNVSLDATSPQYITKVLGNDNFSQSYIDNPVYVHEVYPNWLKNAFEQGKIRGLQTTFEYDDVSVDFLTEWDTPMSATVVSEVRGGEVADLFQVITISDGEAANFQVKISTFLCELRPDLTRQEESFLP